MNVLVCSKVSIPAKDRTLPAWEYLRSLGHQVVVEHPNSEQVKVAPDTLISMGITVMEETFDALRRFPGTPLYCYNWDCYEWVWTNPRPGEYDYRRYGELLRQAREVWVPSLCTGIRTNQWWQIMEARPGVPGWWVVLSACPWWDWEYGPEEKDGGYALCTLREIPDPWWGKLEVACEQLGIPLIMTKHEVSYREYQEAVAYCRFLVSPLWELSTGGLTLMEGYRLGKPCLLSDSPWHGGRDYMGDRATYFKHGDEGDFRRKLLEMHRLPPIIDREDARSWVETRYSDKRMINDMLGRMLATL